MDRTQGARVKRSILINQLTHPCASSTEQPVSKSFRNALSQLTEGLIAIDEGNGGLLDHLLGSSHSRLYYCSNAFLADDMYLHADVKLRLI
jgi:hypothetical protein